VTVLKFIVFNV